MDYAFFFVLGAAGSAAILIICYYTRVALLKNERRKLENWGDRLSSDSSTLVKQARDLEAGRAELDRVFAWNNRYLDDQRKKQASDLEARQAEFNGVVARDNRDLGDKRREFDKALATFEARKVQYNGLLNESNSLKRDLFNLSVQLKKTDRDHAAITQHQEEIDQKANELAKRYLDENVSWIAGKLTPNNFGTCKKRLLKVVERSRDLGFDVPETDLDRLIQDLKSLFEKAVRAEFQRQEQARIKAQIREEEKLAREIDKEIQEAQREQVVIQAALDKALARAKDEHSAEVEHLRARLREAEANAERAKSRAQLTKSGHVYVISNIGSFGEGVYKIGMSRRLEPMERVKELGGASVPFPFDVHMMISSDDAPSLENALHRELHKQRLNKVNFRKEFFRVDLESIRKVVEASHGEVDFVADAEAIQYRGTLDLADEDFEFVEEIVHSIEGNGDDSELDD